MAIYDDRNFFENYLQLRQDKRNYNDNIEQPILQKLIGSCEGERVLDIGCGYGGTCAWLRANGAKNVTGIDNSFRMIDYAQAHNSAENIQYLLLEASELSKLDKKFDLVVSSLVFHYIKDLDKLFQDIRSLCVPGGRLVFSMEHPIYTANESSDDQWEFDEEGKKKAFKLRNYGAEGVRHVEWLGKKIEKFHRKAATVLNSLICAGFSPVFVVEPSPTDEEIEGYERLRQEFHRPAYLIISAK